MNNPQQNMLVLENKSKVLLLQHIKGTYWREYELAIKVYYYLKGKLDRIDSHANQGDFIKVLYKDFPYAKTLLLSDFPYYSSSAEAHREITKLQRYKAIYKALHLSSKLPILYEELNKLTPKQLALF